MMADQAGVAAACDDREDAGFYEVEGCEAQAEALFWLNRAADLGDEEAAGYILLAGEIGVDPAAFSLAAKTTAQTKEPA